MTNSEIKVLGISGSLPSGFYNTAALREAVRFNTQRG